jgi:hypothetical protein
LGKNTTRRILDPKALDTVKAALVRATKQVNARITFPIMVEENGGEKNEEFLQALTRDRNS